MFIVMGITGYLSTFFHSFLFTKVESGYVAKFNLKGLIEYIIGHVLVYGIAYLAILLTK